MKELRPVPDSVFHDVDMPTIALGRLLYFDSILSGNRNIACATCHHPAFGTSDEVSLSFGDGGAGLGPARKPVIGDNRPEQRIAYNSPSLFNLGASEFEVLFHDGRLEADSLKNGGIRTLLDEDMTAGFNGVLSAQAMFPALSGDEMAGHYSENDVAKAVRQGMRASDGGA